MKVLFIESDRRFAKLLQQEAKKHAIESKVATSATEAIAIADDLQPDAVVLELRLQGHSGSEFLYEYRTYSEWQSTPVFIYSAMTPQSTALQSKDWQLLNITEYCYKPDVSIAQLLDKLIDTVPASKK